VSRGRIQLLGGLLALALALPAAAEDTLVLLAGRNADAARWDGPLADDPLLAGSDVEARSLSELVFRGAQLWPEGVPAALCPSRLEAASLAEDLGRARTALAAWRYDEAVEALAIVAERYPCVAMPLDDDELSAAAMALGYAEFARGDLDRAEAAFVLAAVGGEAPAWDAEYPPDAQELYEQVVADTLAAADAWLEVDAGAASRRGLDVDGELVPRSASLRPGAHRVTVLDGDRQPVRLRIDLTPGASVTLRSTDDLVDGWLEGSLSTAVPEAVAAALADEARPVVILDTRRGRLFRLDPGSGALESAGSLAGAGIGGGGGARWQEMSDRKRAGVVTAITGAALGVAGFAMHGATYRAGLSEIEERAHEMGPDYTLEQERAHDWAFGQMREANQAGFAIGVAGVGVGVAGVILWLAPERGDTSGLAVRPGPVTTVGWNF